jgi:hypothetical protein
MANKHPRPLESWHEALEDSGAVPLLTHFKLNN